MSTGDCIKGVIVGCLLLLMIFWLRAWMAGVRRQRVKTTREVATLPDWSTVTDYVELANAASTAHHLSPDEFLDGPFRRFLELCLGPDEHPRVRARMMEFGRAQFIGYLRSQAERRADVEALHARGRALAAEWFGRPEAADGEYMLEVFDGYSNHNYRGKPGDAGPQLEPEKCR